MRLSGKEHAKKHISRCYICKDLAICLKPILESMIKSSSRYDFETFAIGTQIKPSIIERDDFIRSEFKLRGADSVKSGITRELSRKFSLRTKKLLDAFDPDLTFTVNTRDVLFQIRTKPVVLGGSYAKTKRGFPQKQAPCSNCSGRGCMTCGMHGIDSFESVEGKISEMLFSKFDCTTVKFTWIGGEDKSSLVLGTGRPFFAKIQNPVKRNPKLARKMRLDFVELHDCKILENFPKMPIKFHSTIKIKVSVENPLDSTMLKRLKSGFRHPVLVYEDSGKCTEKSVAVRYKKTSSHSIELTVDADGGLPVKRFVEGDNVVPNVSQILKNTCRCARFDFLNVC